MNLNHLTDNELIQYTIKHDDDPLRIRLATIMERMPGAILDDLEDAGMDPEFCNFENTYLPGQYIRHLESELEIYQDENIHLRKELEEMQARSIMDLIAELKQEVRTAEYVAAEARRERQEEARLRKEAEDKWDMWDKLHHGVRS